MEKDKEKEKEKKETNSQSPLSPHRNRSSKASASSEDLAESVSLLKKGKKKKYTSTNGRPSSSLDASTTILLSPKRASERDKDKERHEPSTPEKERLEIPVTRPRAETLDPKSPSRGSKMFDMLGNLTRKHSGSKYAKSESTSPTEKSPTGPPAIIKKPRTLR
eukprot:TRINITY_DN8343_c0_g1_i1.p1 TRINITY_DN8343_c0_g1~~TRINITY_DN8343_c0_g1_i1.p1  ORF type:complete len:163 (-),score=47.33 TRINITY_DN8343_c0_g1_i1:12-500(-)